MRTSEPPGPSSRRHHPHPGRPPSQTGQTTTVGALLRSWRMHRRLSQLALSGLSEVSTRHLSCVETGKSRPSADLLLTLAHHLDVPLPERDRLLVAAGHAPRFGRHPVDAESMREVMSGMRHLLDAHLPYPAVLLDAHWDIVASNAGARRLLTGCHPSLLEPPVNALRISLHPDGLAPRIRNLDAWAGHVLGQLTSRIQHTLDPELVALRDELLQLVAPSRSAHAPPASPVLAMELEHRGAILRFFTVMAALETPYDSVLEGLHLETFLPADEATRASLQSGQRSPADHEPDRSSDGSTARGGTGEDTTSELVV